MESEHNPVDDSKLARLVEADNMLSHVAPGRDSSSFIAEKNSEGGQTMTPLGSLPNDIFIYRQDAVKCSKFEGLLGVVLEVAGDSDSEGSMTDDSDSEDDRDRDDGAVVGGDDDEGNMNGDDRNDSILDGQVRVVWTNGSETIENVSDITVVDRNFFHGDIVAPVSDPTGQLGLVLDVCITVDLRAANGEVIRNVSSKELKPVREFAIGDYVVLGPWLGRVDDVLDNVTVLFDDGSVCKVAKADPLRLKPVMKPVIDDSSCPYYPGQRVRAVSSSVFKTSRWLSGLWKANRLEGTVTKVETASVVVYWIASAYLGIGTNSATVPSEEQNPMDLTLVSCFSYANWQLGDWCFLPSFSLPCSSVADGMPKTSNPKEHIVGDQPHIRHSTECSVSELTDININSCAGSCLQDLDVPELDHEGHQLSQISNADGAIKDETLYHGLVNSSDSKDIEFISTQVGCVENDSYFQSQGGDCMELDKMIKQGENNEPEPSNVLPEGGSCSSSSSALKETTHESWPMYRKKLRKVLFKRDKKARKRDETFERALFIVNTMSKVDVAWQDGTREYGLESRSLIPIRNQSDHEFFPEQYVVEKAPQEDDDTSEMKRVGVVKSVNSKERTVCVRWLKPISRPEDSREFDYDEVVSAYELDEHPDYDYCYGDVVVRLSPVSVSADMANSGSPSVVQDQQADMLGTEVAASANLSNYEEGEHLSKDEEFENFKSLSWVGNITGLQDGDIEVAWADGMVSKVGPQAVYVVGREDDGDSFDGGSEVVDDGASWETVDENEMDTMVNTEKAPDAQEASSQRPSDDILERESSNFVPAEDNSVGRNGPLSMPLAALGFVTRLASGLFSRGKKQLNSDHMAIDEIGTMERQDASDKEESIEEDNPVDCNAMDHHSAHNGLQTAEEQSHVKVTGCAEVMAVDNMDSSVPVGMNSGSTGEDANDDHCSFKHFDIAENPLDHYFLGGSSQSTGGRKWVKKVQQEWSILERNLPDAIYVRVFEDRMDLLRAVIVGACGTPYQDGLFFFDFHLPPEYPQVPPSAYYHSGGLRVNPNLYVDGKVCLSLLNTWTGKGNEVWDPSSSSILQVLVSLQGLVLNSKPYFNEAGYEKQVGTIEGEKNSLPYNENTYLLNLKSMLYLIRRPPMHFEGFVRDHFQRRGHYILKACEAYMGDCLIGSLTKDACMTEKSKEHSCSVGFKLMLAKILPKLISVLSEVGVDCHQFENLQKSENLPKS